MTRQKVGNDSNFCGELGNAENGLLIPIPLYFLKCLSRASSLAGKLADWFFRADRIPIKEITGKAKNIALIERSRTKQKKEGGISIQEMRRRLEKPKDLKRP